MGCLADRVRLPNFLQALWGHDDFNKAAKIMKDVPDLQSLQKIQSLFDACQTQVVNPSYFLDLILALVESKSKSHWTVGFFVVIGTGEGIRVHYFGSESPRMLFLMRLLPHSPISTWFVASSSFKPGLAIGGTMVTMVRTIPMSIAGDLLNRDEELGVEYKQGLCRISRNIAS